MDRRLLNIAALSAISPHVEVRATRRRGPWQLGPNGLPCGRAGEEQLLPQLPVLRFTHL
jgi:hypothetical protein